MKASPSHSLGDKAISALAAAIHNVLRDSDVAGRIGGDEFVVVMMTADAQALPKMLAGQDVLGK